MKRTCLMLALAAALMLAGCANQMWLNDEIGRAGRAQVERRYGPPDSCKPWPDGGALCHWTEIGRRQIQQPPYQEPVPLYAVFDAKGVLQAWAYDTPPD